METKKYDAIIVGAGFGGSSCAALLAKRGLKVLLLEKNKVAGGKAMSVTRNGYTSTMWIVTGTPVNNNHHEVVLKELGLSGAIKFVPSKEMLFVHEKDGAESKKMTMKMGEGERVNPEMLWDWLEVEGKQKEDCMRFLRDIATMPNEEIDKLQDISYADFIHRYDVPPQVYSFLTACWGDPFLVVPPDVMSAWEVVITRQKALRNGSGYEVEGGAGKIAELFTDSVIKNGGTVMMNTYVEKIIVEDGKATGVATNKGTFKAPIIISNAGIQPTVLKLVGEEYFDKGYVNYVKDLTMSLGWMGCNYYMSKPVTSADVMLIFRDGDETTAEHYISGTKKDGTPNNSALIVVVPSNFCPKNAPEGKQLIQIGYSCPPDADCMTKEEEEALNDYMEKRLFKIIPDMPKYIENKEITTTKMVKAFSRNYDIPGQGGEVIGLGEVIHQCGKYRPSPTSPIQGLFYVGTDAGGHGACGTNLASDSGYKVSKLVQEYHVTHHEYKNNVRRKGR
ncbi:MAG: phytoene desaturase family protein [Mobilitalea sp.]